MKLFVACIHDCWTCNAVKRNNCCWQHHFSRNITENMLDANMGYPSHESPRVVVVVVLNLSILLNSITLCQSPFSDHASFQINADNSYGTFCALHWRSLSRLSLLCAHEGNRTRGLQPGPNELSSTQTCRMYPFWYWIKDFIYLLLLFLISTLRILIERDVKQGCLLCHFNIGAKVHPQLIVHFG